VGIGEAPRVALAGNRGHCERIARVKISAPENDTGRPAPRRAFGRFSPRTAASR
jgi:hypothetical protein